MRQKHASSSVRKDMAASYAQKAKLDSTLIVEGCGSSAASEMYGSTSLSELAGGVGFGGRGQVHELSA
jgi:hypothetical protein